MTDKHVYKVVWTAGISASSPREAACYAIEIGSQFFGTATVFRVDGELVDVEGDEPSQNRFCYDIGTLTQAQIALVMNEWMRRYIDEPDAFSSQFADIKRFLAESMGDVEPSYGDNCAAYLAKIAADLGMVG